MYNPNEQEKKGFLGSAPVVHQVQGRQAPQGGGAPQGGPISSLASGAMSKLATKGVNAAGTGLANAAAGSSSGVLSGLGTALGGTAGAGGAGLMATMAPIALPLAGAAALGKVFNLFNDGTTGVPEMDYGPDPLAGAYAMSPHTQPMNNGGYAGWQQHAQGTDSVPAMLTPGEAVIPAGAAQDPANQAHIQGMIDQGRQMNQGIPAPAPSEMGGPMAAQPQSSLMGSQAASPMAGPLSGKTQREEMKVLQDLSLKKKAFEAEEQRKQELHNQKMQMAAQKNQQAMKQAQE